MAHEVGKYTLMGDGDKVLDSGKYVVIWQRQDGQWKLHRDIWNSSQPAPKQ
jgi:ketosteroid isomerase-like protein